MNTIKFFDNKCAILQVNGTIQDVLPGDGRINQDEFLKLLLALIRENIDSDKEIFLPEIKIDFFNENECKFTIDYKQDGEAVKADIVLIHTWHAFK